MMTLEEMALAAKNYFAHKETAVDETGGSSGGTEYEILFDSHAQPLSADVRNSVVAARQLLFRIGPVFVDLEVGRQTDSDQALLIGQMLDSANPGHPPVGVPIVLLDRGRRVAATSSNDHGEFHLQFALKSNLRLALTFDRDRPVHLPITSPGGKVSGGRVKRYKPLGSIESRTIAQ